MVESIVENTRRYVNLFSEVISEMLPTYKEHSAIAKDSLDVYIEHRILMQSRTRNPNEQHDPKNQFPPELMRRL